MKRPILLAVWILAAAAPSAAAQSSSFPDTPAGRAAAEVMEIANAADSAAAARFIAARFSPGFRDALPLRDHLRAWREMEAESGGYDLEEIRSASVGRVEAVLRARRDGVLHVISLEVEPAPPHRIVTMGISPLDQRPEVEPGPAPSRRLSDAELEAELADYLERLVEADRFSGVVLVVRDGRIVFDRAYGMAERGHGVPVRSDTKFNLGSMNKMFTAVTIAKLAQEGRLSLEDPIGRWLGPDWVRPDVGEKVTIAHLLTHTSGLGSYFTPEFFDANLTRFREVSDYAPLVSGDSLAFEPGSGRTYSNTGFLLLGAIVEVVTGRSYFDVVREVVYEPAGMTDTDAYSMDQVVPNLAIGYDPQSGPEGLRWRNNLFLHPIRGGPAGGGFSTAPDLVHFARALREHRLLSPDWTTRVTSPKPELGSPRYGYGFQIWDNGRIGHGGGFPGISSMLKLDLDRDDVVVVLSNVSMGERAVTRKVEELLGPP